MYPHSAEAAAALRYGMPLNGDQPKQKGKRGFPLGIGAGDESRTRDLNLGKVALYQLSYSRIQL
ncbi:hypothetical protein CBM2605_A180020 [Cupriavidus neocaledonicus]|uniref:Uncharacterized protein n=1 Tax=Cupriavidus neocaledonicus TaxID=1040979 RepID=A0ABY1UZ75_9BURK|nr:hypothetical protein CBM2605_A180020 [Cupriavidus neocaledonicus]